MENILTLLNKIFSKFTIASLPIDKQMHFLSGFIGSLLLSFIIGYWAVLVISIIGALKEWYDFLHPTLHTADTLDWLATTLGASLGVVWLILTL